MHLNFFTQTDNCLAFELCVKFDFIEFSLNSISHKIYVVFKMWSINLFLMLSFLYNMMRI